MFRKELPKALVMLGFVFLSLFLAQMHFNQIFGTGMSFTLINFWAPALAGVLGPALGVFAVAGMYAIGIPLGFFSLDLGTLVYILPLSLVGFVTLSASALYFGSRSKLLAVIPALCILLFLLSPIGSSAWFYALPWLLPIAVLWKSDLFVFRHKVFPLALGATYIDHAVGSVTYLYAASLYPGALGGLLAPEVWTATLPISIIERLLMAAGITVTYILAYNALKFAAKNVDEAYLVFGWLKKMKREQHFLAPEYW